MGILDISEVPSGLSRYVEVLLSGIDPDQFEIVLFCRQTGPYRPRTGVQMVYLPSDEEAKGGGAAIPVPPGWGRALVRRGWRRLAPTAVKLWVGFLRQSLRLKRLFQANPVDLLHVQVVASEEAVLGARLAGIPRILGTFHIDSTQSKPRDWPLEWITNHALHRAIAVSSGTKADWMRRCCLPGRRVVVIPNGVDPERFRRQASREEARARLELPVDDSPVVASVGRLASQKGYTYLLQAVAELVVDFPKLTLVLAGDGPLRQELAEQARQLGIGVQVHFLGFRKDVQDVLDAADLFALPSLWEAMPYALLEAMAAGLPVVGTAVAGVPEAIESGQTGFLVPPADSAALACALRSLLQSAPLCRRIGQAGRERIARQFNLEGMLRLTLGVYREMLAGGPNTQRKAAG